MKYYRFVWIAIIPLLFATACRKKQARPIDEDEMYASVFVPASEGSYHEAITIADSLLANETMGDSLRAYIMIERDVALFNMGNMDAAAAYADTLLEFGKRTGVVQAQLQALQVQGMHARRNGDYDKAVEIYSAAIRKANADNNNEMEQTFAESIAIVFTEMSRNNEARHFADRSLSLAESMGDTTAIFSTIATLGAVETRENHPEKAVSILAPYRPLMPDMPSSLRIKYLTPLLRAYILLDSIVAAERTIAEMENETKYLPLNHQSRVNTLTSKALVAGLKGDYPQQWEIYKTLDTLDQHGKTLDIILTERAECLANMRQYKNAYEYMERAHAALDSLRHVDVDSRLNDLSVKYGILEKQLQIERLSRQRWIFTAIASVSILFLIILTIIYIGSRRRSKMRLEEEKHRQYILGLEQERARMARELHDDIAGELIGLQYALEDIGCPVQSDHIREIAMKVRVMSHEMMPPQFGDTSFTSLLLDFVARSNKSAIPPVITVTDEGSFEWNSLAPAQCLELYRIVQEAVNNARKHSSPSRIIITLDGNEKFSLSVENDGLPDSDESVDNTSGIGIRTIRSRAEILNADISVSTANGVYKLKITQK